MKKTKLPKLQKHLEVKLNRANLRHANKNKNELMQELFPNLTKDKIIYIDQIKKLQKRLSPLKLENQIYCVFGLAIYTCAYQNNSLSNEKKAVVKTIASALNCRHYSDNHIEKFLANPPLNIFTSEDLFPSYQTFQKINDIIHNININRQSKYQFIKKIKSNQLGNLFKIIYLIKYNGIDTFFIDQKNDLDALTTYLKTPKEKIKSIAINEAYDNIKQNHILANELNYWGMSPVELSEYKSYLFQLAHTLLQPSFFMENLKACLIFSKSNKKGIAVILYSLFQIIDPINFPTKQELEDQNADLTLNSNDWFKFRFRTINRIINIDDLFTNK